MAHNTVESLSQSITGILALEGEIEEILASMPQSLGEQTEASEVVNNLRVTAKSHQENLNRRLESISQGSDYDIRTGPSTKGGEFPGLETLSSSSLALATLYGRLNQAAFEYAILHVVAHRAYDSSGEGNTADLAEGHLRDYVQAIQALSQVVSDVAVWEQRNFALECHCKCPSCGLGICLCPPHGGNTVEDIWREVFTKPAKRADGIRVRPPRNGSSAARAGIHAGDFVVAVDDREIGDESWDSIKIMQDSIRKHPSGESVHFKLRHASGALEEVTTIRE